MDGSPAASAPTRAIVVPSGKESVDGSSSARQRGEQGVIVARGRGEQARLRVRSPSKVEKPSDSGSAVEVDRDGAPRSLPPSAARRAAARRTRPSWRWACGASSCPAPSCGRGRAVEVDQRARRVRDPPRSCVSPAADIAERADDPQMIAGRAPPARSGVRGPALADRGHPEHARRAGRQSDRVAAEQRQRRSFRTRPRRPLEEALLPIARRRHIVRDSKAPRGVAPLAARSERFTATSFQPTSPADRSGRKWMPSAMLSWVRTRPSSTADIVEQPARFRRGRHAPQARDDLGFAHLLARGRAARAWRWRRAGR